MAEGNAFPPVRMPCRDLLLYRSQADDIINSLYQLEFSGVPL